MPLFVFWYLYHEKKTSKNMFRFTSALVLTLSALTIFSCDDSEAPDTKAPEIIIESPTENQRVARTITIAATAKDRDKEVAMQAFLDGNLLQESFDGINVQVDTKTLTEGTHTVKLTAIDKAENASEETYDIEVRNTLFKAQISSNYADEFTKIYFALSKNDGTIISFNEAVNGGSITIPTPADFNPDSTFALTEYFYYYDVSGDYSTVVRSTLVSAGLTAGEFQTAEYRISLPKTGSHHINITDVPIQYYSAGLTGKNLHSPVGYFGATGTITTDLNMTSNSSDLLFYFRLTDEPGQVYKYINNIADGGSTEFSLTGLPQMPKADVTAKDAVGSFRCYVYADVENRYFSLYSDEGTFDNGKLPVYYPGTTYSKYIFDLNYTGASGNCFSHTIGATPPTAFSYVTGSVSNVNYVNRQMKVTATGTFDVATVNGGGGVFDTYTSVYDFYNVSFPNGTKNKVVISNPPTAMADLGFKSPTTFIFTSLMLYDYTGLSGANDYKSKIVFSADKTPRHLRDYISTGSSVTTTSSGGRISTQNIILPKRLENALRDRLPPNISFE